MSILHLAERVHGTGIVLVITTPEEMAHGTDTRIAAVDEGVCSLGVSTLHVCIAFLACIYKVSPVAI